jgi:hypothetical protein
MRESKKDLKALLNEAEFRAGRHFDKLMEIENIIRKADERHEMAVFTLKDIKKVLSMT